MKIAVTGASGRIGQAITRLALARGHQVTMIDRTPPAEQAAQGANFIAVDMADYDGLVAAMAGCDGLIHMAAIPMPGQQPDHVVHNNNVVGSYNALRAAVETGMVRLCQASSVNAVGHSFSRAPRYDYFPIDEGHKTYAEDPYSLSKWICEQQADVLARRYETLAIASLRFHLAVPDAQRALDWHARASNFATHLWAWTQVDAAADACLLSLEADFRGHEVFYIVAPQTLSSVPTADLAAAHFPDVPLRGALPGHTSFFDSSKAERVLGWRHET